MKSKSFFTGAIALACATTALADVTVDITGATAFRVATLDSIKAQFVASGQPFKFAHDRNTSNGQSFNGATRAIFQGTFPGVSGTTTIRTSFNGSVEGLNALVNSPSADPTYYDPTDPDFVNIAPAIGGNNGGLGLGNVPPHNIGTVPAQSEIAFSDVSIAATPFAGNSLQPASPAAGVVVFTMIANDGTPASVTNITNKQFQALFQTGYVPLSLLTGNASDSSKYVFATGRNDGSGTRTTYLAETGYGISNPVNQYVVGASTSGSNGMITQIHRVPAGGYSPSIPGSSADNKSTIWGQDIDGNGGYFSGSKLRDDMMKVSGTNTQVLEADGSEAIPAGSTEIYLVSWLSLGDASPAYLGGARILGYNGVRLNDFATSGTLSAADKAKVTEGAYTAWSYQQMYRRNDIVSGDVVTVYNAIKNNLVLGTTGIPISQMNVSRQTDGGVVTP